MYKQISISLLALGLLAIVPASAGAADWAVKGDYVESCSCAPACPCHFGSSPTLGHCEGGGLLEIKEGHYGDVRLDGISVVNIVRIGEWVKYYVSDNATDEQVKAVEPLMGAVFGYLRDMKPLSIEKAPVSVERTATTVKFSVPTSTVEIEMMKGRNGKPIKIQNLPFSYLKDHTQYKSVTNTHESKDKKFSYSGTNGLTSKVDVVSKK
jgi:hypothetical protein